MQYPVPQFTDVEDKIIGSLSIKQFGIVFGAGIIVFLIYSASKSILITVFFGFIIGVPAIALAFVPYNGRPMYNTIGLLFKFVASPKELIFHKEVSSINNVTKFRDANIKNKVEAKPAEVSDPQDNLRKVQELLRNTASEERKITQQQGRE